MRTGSRGLLRFLLLVALQLAFSHSLFQKKLISKTKVVKKDGKRLANTLASLG